MNKLPPHNPLPLPLNEPGPVLRYLEKLRTHDPKAHDATYAALRTLLSHPDGAILLDLLEKSTALSLTPIGADVGALVSRNAQAFIASDLRRILSDEYERLLEQNQVATSRRTNR